MLTISQIAAFAGVTVRTVRHYHQAGLLPEPDRDASGYRRYGGEDVITLMRIKTLARAGVPLARIGPLLDAEPEDFAAAVREIDGELEQRIAELEQRRSDLAALPSAERLCISDEVAAMLDDLRAAGVSERTVAMEREGWILLAAAFPDVLDKALQWKRITLEHPGYRRLLLRLDEAFDWDPEDPRILEMAEQTVDLMEEIYPVSAAQAELVGWSDREAAWYRLVSEHNVDASPAWLRLNALVEQRATARGYPMPTG